MEEQNNKQKDYKLIYNICEEISKLENINEFKNINSGIFITKYSINTLKAKLQYNKVKNLIENKVSYPKYEDTQFAIANLFSNDGNKIFDNILVPYIFSNSKELIDALEKGYEYYLIQKNIYKMINKFEGQDNIKEINFYLEGNNIILKFDEKDIIKFIILQNEFNLISKTNLLMSNIIPGSVPKNSYRESLEIMIDIFFYSQELKEKSDYVFEELEENNNLEVYLINKSWLEKYQSFYEYKELENHLINLFNNNFGQINYIINNVSIEEIISKLPNDYLNKIKNKGIFLINGNEENIEIKTYLCQKNNQVLMYFDNFKIINQNIFQLLIRINYF